MTNTKTQRSYNQLVAGDSGSDELRKEVKLPELKGLESKYDKSDIETMAKRNGFVIQRYEEQQVIIDNEQLRTIHERALTDTEEELIDTLGMKRARRVIQRVKEGLSPLYEGDKFVEGKEVYVYLKKSKSLA